MVVDTNIILQCKTGDKAAFEKLFGIYSGRVGQIAYLLTGNRQTAENIAKESFIRCFRNIKHLRCEKNFEKWFLRIVVFSAWDHTHSPSACEEAPENVTGGIETLNITSDILSMLESDQNCGILIRSMKKLSFSHRVMIVLRFFSSLTIKDIAAIMNCFEPIVRLWLHSAVKRLADELQSMGWEICLSDGDKRLVKGTAIDQSLHMTGELKKALENGADYIHIGASLFESLMQDLNVRQRMPLRKSIRNMFGSLVYLSSINMKKAQKEKH